MIRGNGGCLGLKNHENGNGEKVHGMFAKLTSREIGDRNSDCIEILLAEWNMSHEPSDATFGCLIANILPIGSKQGEFYYVQGQIMSTDGKYIRIEGGNSIVVPDWEIIEQEVLYKEIPTIYSPRLTFLDRDTWNYIEADEIKYVMDNCDLTYIE